MFPVYSESGVGRSRSGMCKGSSEMEGRVEKGILGFGEHAEYGDCINRSNKSTQTNISITVTKLRTHLRYLIRRVQRQRPSPKPTEINEVRSFVHTTVDFLCSEVVEGDGLHISSKVFNWRVECMNGVEWNGWGVG